ncbi:hypothetical protein PROFUN_01951 [Planoprotostelium fungivorum]|uniref:Uncharacterized protein n=1 Tax=Planoprotostelium fungivorum TaxID=1890364 RepID=A0A2P6NAY9_9EUKA|nr:hypothetical protein PROFUN_01951 [Planoprotostelium fungivorum]
MTTRAGTKFASGAGEKEPNKKPVIDSSSDDEDPKFVTEDRIYEIIRNTNWSSRRKGLARRWLANEASEIEMRRSATVGPSSSSSEMAWHYNKLLETVHLESKQNTYSSCAVISTKLNSILKHNVKRTLKAHPHALASLCLLCSDFCSVCIKHVLGTQKLTNVLQRIYKLIAGRKHSVCDIQCTFIEEELLGFLWFKIILYKQRLIELFNSYVSLIQMSYSQVSHLICLILSTHTWILTQKPINNRDDSHTISPRPNHFVEVSINNRQILHKQLQKKMQLKTPMGLAIVKSVHVLILI